MHLSANNTFCSFHSDVGNSFSPTGPVLLTVFVTVCNNLCVRKSLWGSNVLTCSRVECGVSRPFVNGQTFLKQTLCLKCENLRFWRILNNLTNNKVRFVRSYG